MGLKILLGIVWISVCGLPRFGESTDPSWTSDTYTKSVEKDGKMVTIITKVYAIQDGAFTFHWRYNDGSTSLDYVKWTLDRSHDNTGNLIGIASQRPGQSITVIPSYKSRTRFFNGVSVEIKQLKYPTDEGIYKCDLSFTNVFSLIDRAELIVVVPPTITQRTSGPITIAEGVTKTLECAADGNPTPMIKWTLRDVNNNLRVVQHSDNHYGYNITNAGRKDKGTYTCEAKVTGGSFIKQTSYSVIVAVKYKPEVTHISPNQSSTENYDVHIECTAVGDPEITQYHWYKKEDDPVFKITNGGKYRIWGNLGRKLTIKTLSKEDSDWYYCAAENSLGIGNGTKTYVGALYAPTKVTITYKPGNPVNLTQAVTLKCVSDGMPLPMITWKFNDHSLNSNTQVIRGDRHKEVWISKLTRELTGNYTCLAANVHGNKKNTDILHVNYKPEKPYFTTGLPKLGAIRGSHTRLTCKADGYPPPHFVIKKNGAKVSSGAQDYYMFSPVKINDESDTFTCTPFNLMGQGKETEKSSIRVLVRPVFIKGLTPTKIVKTENDTKNYTCIADAKPRADIIWYINSDNVTYDKPYMGVTVTITKQSQNNPKYHTTESTLILDPITWRHDGNISCVASNDAGAQLSYTLLEVRHRPVVRNADELPNNKTVDTGRDVTFTCPAKGNPPTTSYRWRFNGKLIPNEFSSSYIENNVNSDDVGKYSCTGINSFGEGPPFVVTLFIKTPAKVIYHPKVIANETGSATLVCKAVGIPPPVIHWYKGASKRLHEGEKYFLTNLTYDDRGLYQCVAINELNVDKVNVELVVQVKPNITSDKPTDTQIAGVIREKSSMHCTVVSTPPAKIWWTRASETDPLNVRSDRVVSISEADSAKTLIIEVIEFGEVYYCHARNILGYAKERYTIRRKGQPDAPIDLKLYTLKVSGKRTVDVNVTWIAGYSGGYQQYFTILFKPMGAKGFTEIVIDKLVAGTHYIMKELKPHSTFVFKVRSRNERGQSKESREVTYTTEASDIPPARGILRVTRIEDGTVFQLAWTMNKNVTATYLQYREVTTSNRARRSTTNYDYGRWNTVEGAQGLSRNITNFLVVNLDKDKTYQFRILFKVANEIGFKQEMVVESEIVQPILNPKPRTGLKQDELIAIIAASGGVLLIFIVVLCLCCFKRRKKPYGADSVQMSQTGSAPNLFSTYGDGTVDTRATNRRSYATESVEDDPFIDAHIANEIKKKRRPTENGINHGYASQDSFPPQEILLNPGSRSGIRGMSQSVGQLDGRSSYSSTGPQRDFSTLPPYHEPPSFEEAIRQSVRKSKQALSTGDLTAEPRYQQGRSRARTPDSDTSDSETPLNRRPMFKVRPLDPASDKRYKSAPALPPESPVRRGPRDPSVLYSRPQKKVLNNEPVDMFGSPPWEYIDHNYHAKASSGWPPPSYTPEDRADIPGMEEDYEPRVNKRRPIADDVMELEDRPSYRRKDRLPDLPPSMPEFSGGRGTMQKEPIAETLPEPPSFLRGLSNEDDEPDGRYSRSFTEPRNRTRQPYVNIHGQLVRPNSPGRQPAYGSDHQEPIYANDPPRLVAPEPEVPVNQRRNRQPSSGEQHQPGYVSSGFLV